MSRRLFARQGWTSLLFASLLLVGWACSGGDGKSLPDLTEDQTAADAADQTSPDLLQDQLPSDLAADLRQDLASDSVQPQDLVDSLDQQADDLADISDVPDVLPPDTLPELSELSDQDAPDVAIVPLEGFGTITGECGVLDPEELESASPYLFVNHLDFDDTPYTGDLSVLSIGAQEVYTDGNAGGSSSYSETFSFDVLYRCELAQLLKTETEIVYDDAGTMTDFLVEVDGHKIGVSVVRAQSFPLTADYTLETADKTLRKKLTGILASSSLVSDEDAWVKQILHVIAYNQQHADMVLTAWNAIEAEVKADTIVVITVTDGADEWIYNE